MSTTYTMMQSTRKNLYVSASVMVLSSALILIFYALKFSVVKVASSSKFLFTDKITSTKKIVNSILNTIYLKWQVRDFPTFLKSVAMSEQSWELLKLKYELKILQSFIGKNERETFIVSFMGSSVTAGHDSPYNMSFPVLTGHVMKPAFDELGIEFYTRNAGIGNNPCLPYDFCVNTFAGPDADIVHWEQSYNCGGRNKEHLVAFEQFIRQSFFLKNKAITVFSNSATPNWKVDHCKDPPPQPPFTEYEQKLINALLEPNNANNKNSSISSFHSGVFKIVSKINNENYNKDSQFQWNLLSDMFKTYQKVSGTQIWSHKFYEEKKCYGPYIPDWACCKVAGWHPSRLGHQLRADHYSFFWLAVLEDTLDTLLLHDLTDDDKLNEYYKTVLKKFETLYKNDFPSKPIYESSYSDSMSCYTSYQPLNNHQLNLFDLVIAPSFSSSHIYDNRTSDLKQLFQKSTMEIAMDPKILKKAKNQGYLDYKNMLYGNNESIPLSLKINVHTAGFLHICQPPGAWGKLPQGFTSILHETNVHFYLKSINHTKSINGHIDSHEFNNNDSRTIQLDVKPSYSKTSQNMCVESKIKLSTGQYVLSIVPQLKEYVMISFILIP